MTRPVVNGLRLEYQERINFVILDYDRGDDSALADTLGVPSHPAFAVLEPDSNSVAERFFGPVPESFIREKIESALEAGAG
ncbi:MAG: hypothetical protein R3C39_01690 [Dehalococcoidia bacterium]